MEKSDISKPLLSQSERISFLFLYGLPDLTYYDFDGN